MKSLKEPTKLQIAWQLFWSILRGKPHIYCDHKIRSIIGTREEVTYFQNSITDMYNSKVYETLWMEEVKKILK